MIEIGTAHRNTTTTHLQSPPSSSTPHPLPSSPSIPTTTTTEKVNTTLPPVRLVPSASASTRISKKLWSGTVQPQQMNHQRISSPPQSCDTNLTDTTTTTTTTPIATTTTTASTTTKRRLHKFWQQNDTTKPPSSSFSLRSLKQRAEEKQRSLFSQKANTTFEHALNKQQQSHVVYRRHASVPAPGCSVLNAPSTLEQSLTRIRRQCRQQDKTTALENLKHVIALLDRHPYYRKRLASRREQFESLCEDNVCYITG